MTAEQIYSLLDSLIKIGLGALAGIVTTWIASRKAIEKLKIEHAHDNQKLVYERDSQIFRKFLLDVEQFDQKLGELTKTALEKATYEKLHCETLETLEGKRKEIIQGLAPGPDINHINQINIFINNEVEKAYKLLEGYLSSHSSAMNDFGIALSEIVTSSYLTGDEELIELSSKFGTAAQEIFTILHHKDFDKNKVCELNYANVQATKQILRVVLSKKYRELLAR